MGADPRNLDRFVREFDAKTFHLRTNFRCADRIVEAANKLLGTTSGGAQSIVAAGRAPGFVMASSYADEAGEAAAVVDWILHLRDHGLEPTWISSVEDPAVAPSELAILGRSRLHLRGVLGRLDALRVPYVFRAGDTGPFDSEIYRVTLDALRVLANPRDLAMRRTLLAAVARNSPGDDRLVHVTDAEASVFLSDVADSDTTGAEALIRALADAGSIAEGMSGLATALSVEAAEEDLGELLRADRELLISRWNAYRHTTESRSWTWPTIVAAIVEEPREDPEGIRVSTIHAAKGLEFRAVAVVGLNEGSLPDFRNTSSTDDVAAERRLAYVAVTRASRALLLTRPRLRATRFGGRSQSPSRFLDELGIHVSAV